MNTAAIARHLNIAESAITRCEEWAKVLFVVVQGLGARFVSKKIMTAKLERHGLDFEPFLHKKTAIKGFFVCNEKKYMLKETGSYGLTRCLFDNGVSLPQWQRSKLINDLIDAFGARTAVNKPAKNDTTNTRSHGHGHGLEYDMYSPNGRFFG